MFQIVVFILLCRSAFFTCTAFQLSSSSSSSLSSSLYRQTTHLQKRDIVQHTKIEMFKGFFDSFKDIFKVEEEKPLNVPFKRTDREWRALLTEEEFYVLRGAGTERPWTSLLNDEKRPGEFTCKGCGKTLFTSSTKFNSGTGWPSFFAPASSSSVLERKDLFMGLQRTEVLCSNCGSHLGHVFNDGPRPTKQRYIYK